MAMNICPQHHHRSCRDCRGFALLLVLATLIIVVTAAAGLARTAATEHTRRQRNQHEQMAQDVMRAAEAPLLAWLNHASSKIALPPDNSTPGVLVLDDHWSTPEMTFGLRVTAWDQLGMAPLQVARSGSPLRLALPSEVLQVIDTTDIPPAIPAGLDLFIADDSRYRDLAVFPSDPDGTASIGALVATHNQQPIRINVNTAPMPLLEQAMRLAGRSGVEAIRQARADGRLAPAGSASSSQASRSEFTPRIVAASDLWAFRIDVRVSAVLQSRDFESGSRAGVHRSWWAIYSKADSSWECIQRLVITQ